MNETERERFMRETSEAINQAEAEETADHTVQDVRDAISTGGGVEMYNTATASVTVTSSGTDGITYVNNPPSTPTQTSADSEDLAQILEAESVAEVTRLIDAGEVEVTEDGERLSFNEEREAEPDEDKKPKESTKEIRARMRKENPAYYANCAKEALDEKRFKNITNLNKKRAVQKEYLKNVMLTHDKIIFDSKGSFVHTTLVQGDKFEDGSRSSTRLMFDKQFNLLAPVGTSGRQARLLRRPDGIFETKLKHHGARVHVRQLAKYDDSRLMGPLSKRFFIVDKGLLLTSTEQKFKVLHRTPDMKPIDMVDVKKKFFAALSEMQKAVNYLSNAVGQVLPPEDFEVLYDLKSLRGVNYITLSMRFHDVTISNSLEMEREIGDIVVAQTVEHWMDTGAVKPYLKFSSEVKGLRMKWTFVDANAGYSHSHIPSGNPDGINNFCTGSENYGLDEPNAMAIEAHVHRLREFISWESLEGGPHYRMESIKTTGKPFRTVDSIVMAVMPDKRYWTEMWIHLKKDPENLKKLERCFRLIKGDRGLMWRVDHNQFYLQMMEIFDPDALGNCSKWDRGKSYHYKERNGGFYLVTGRGETDPKRMYTKSIEKVMKIRPIYMNGRYIKPEVNKYENPYVGLRFCPQPQLMYEVIKVILYHLTEKLEKYGTSSDSSKS